ncbi:uncharacterized protein LOC128256941 [Drosophila gunungcola]|uniref:Chitin-binding type-2 domain-containing protein n=1 Tax=Drosophila gunungcola TaxID=103775 RepID=A0A9P9Z1Z7_9MUSC|nr:uncharacterized protein LOC128256941 [Drosophila gunungcola]KAI8046739.1 hypothetical protein M5D96_002952 [Drosophila gunungcola]
MLKALVIFFGLLALSHAASVGTASNATEVCQSEDEMWGGEDIRKFYFCLDGKVITDECDDGYYYVNNATISGCLPSEMMQASCVNLDIKVPDCSEASKMRPQACDDVASFYLCTSEGAKKLPCPEGKAFIDQDGYLGCFKWSVWRSLRNCTDG